MIEPLNRVVRSGSVKSQNPSAETRAGFKKSHKSKISWSCVLLRRSRANSDPGPATTCPLSHNGTSAMCPVSSQTRNYPIPAAVPSKQLHLSSAPMNAVSSCDTDFYDGFPKMWKQSQRFFCDDTVYQRQRNPPPSESVNQFREDTKVWLEDLARRSKSARERRFNCHIFNEQKSLPKLADEGGLSMAPLKPTPGMKLQSSSKGKPVTKNYEGRLLDRSNIHINSGPGRAESGHLHIPYMQRLRPSKSPSLSRVELEEDDSNSCNGLSRLVSTWSSDTLSLFETENQENGQVTLIDSQLDSQENISPCPSA